MRVIAVTHLIINLIEVLLFRKVNTTNLGILLLIQVNLFSFCHKSNVSQTLWTIPVPDVAKTTAVYGEIQNPSDNEITIVALESNEYKKVEFHTMVLDNEGIMRMKKMEFPISLKPKEIIKLERGGSHLMLYDKQTTKEKLMITIQYSNGTMEKHVVEKKSL
ncbi:copper chaperone PCu(A)C [Leptospira bouyouniensis]|uniref:copper chaperone PCu(A)C n=1 Tax=Leptospira bouyouniensis TaxID=2484911 RepID=UPI00142E81EA|nr:copper chaperone PCu(A)C [Leptospira bouyouniensis]